MCEIKNNETLQESGSQECPPAATLGAPETNSTSEVNTDSDNSSKSEEDKESWLQKYGLLLSFFVAIIACCIVYFWAVKLKLNGLEDSQNKIVEIYERQTVKSDKNEQKNFVVFQQPQEDYEKFEEEIKSLLELQKSYIQDNFSSFEIWAGILTIVFLVFSFFSLQKSEQMEQQSRDSLRRIKRNMHDSESRLANFDNKASSKLSVFDSKSSGTIESFKTQYESQIKTFQEQSSSALSGISTKMEEAKTATINEGKDILKREREKASNDFVDKLNILERQLLSDFETSIEGKKNDVEKSLSSAQIRMVGLLKEIENLQQTLNNVKQNNGETEDGDEEATLADEIDD